MSRNIKRSIILASFVIFNYILPAVLFQIEFESNWLFVLLKLFSVAAIFVFMFKSFEMSTIVNYLALTLLFVEITYLVTGLAISYELSNGILSIVVLLSYLVPFFIAFVAYTLKTVHYFQTKSIMPLIVLIFLFIIRRFMELVCLVEDVGYDIGYYTRIGDPDGVISIIHVRGVVFLLYTLTVYIFLEMIFRENDKFSIK